MSDSHQGRASVLHATNQWYLDYEQWYLAPVSIFLVKALGIQIRFRAAVRQTCSQIHCQHTSPGEASPLYALLTSLFEDHPE